MRTRVTSTLLLLLAVMLAAGCTLLPAPAGESAPGAPAVTRAEVIRHTDGDTARFRLASGSEERVRFIGIDTPEVGERAEPFGEEAAAYTADAIPVGTTVWLETDTELRDEYGRLLAYVWLEEPTTGDAAEVREHMLNARLVLDGYANAYTYPPNVKYTDVLTDLQAEAREGGRGFWAE
jgi:micrococcal nuclease